MRSTRRAALRALAAIPVALPLARLLRADAADLPRPLRLVILMQNNGTQQANFWPDAALHSPILDHLFDDPVTGQDRGLRSRTTLVKGVYVPYDANGTNGNAHDMGFARMFTGEKLLSVGGRPWGGGPSVDQILAQDWGIDSLTLAVLASEFEPHPKPGFNHRESFCYLGPGTLKHPRTDPLAAYGELFPGGGGPVAAERLALRQSVLDAVTQNLSEVSRRLGADERRKLDYHLSAVRDVEQRLSKSVICARAPEAPPDFLAQDPGAETTLDTYIPGLVDNLVDLGVGALACNMTRIVTLQFGYGGGKWKFAWEGIGINCHDDVAHHDVGDAGGSPENTELLVRVNRYYARAVARFASALDQVPDGDGSLLDNTLLVWANEQGRGDHSQANVPIVLIGGAGGALPPGGRVIDEGPQPFNRLGATILNVMGKPVAGFGDEPECGSFAGL